MIPKPTAEEYAPFYAGYIATVDRSDVIEVLDEQPSRLRARCAALDEESARYRYGPDKWSIKEVIGHLADSERVFAYRALRIGRGDATPLPGFDEKPYVAAAGFDRRPLASLIGEFAAVRASSLILLRSFGSEVWELRGVASDAPVSVRALVHIMAGHVEHHLSILRERYGLAAATPPTAAAPGPERASR
ncbi:MAG: DinB family protein [Gemmatimonadota bacterium]